MVDRSRTSDRLPGSTSVLVSDRPSASWTLKHTVPTGFSGLPPPGPAMPVVEIGGVGAEAPQGAGGHRLGDGLGHRAVLGDEAAGSTPSNAALASFE